jgi:hypothetical protein
MWPGPDPRVRSSGRCLPYRNQAAGCRSCRLPAAEV